MQKPVSVSVESLFSGSWAALNIWVCEPHKEFVAVNSLNQ